MCMIREKYENHELDDNSKCGLTKSVLRRAI